MSRKNTPPAYGDPAHHACRSQCTAHRITYKSQFRVSHRRNVQMSLMPCTAAACLWAGLEVVGPTLWQAQAMSKWDARSAHLMVP